MPGNEHGDRVHNFFAQDNSSQGQEGKWPVPNNSFWVGSQRPVDILYPSKNFSGQNSEIDRGHSSYPVHAAHGLTFSQPNPRPDFSGSQPLNEQQYSNGSMYGHHGQFSQSRQNEAHFRESDTYSDERHVLASRGLQLHELQRVSSHEQQPRASDRSETSVSPVSFDLFGGKQQMNHKQASMLQALQHQQPGLSDMQQFQQQLMIRKMEVLQRQKQLQQLDLRPQNLINQVHPVSQQASGSQSSMFNGTPNSDASQNTWTAEHGTNWLSHGSSDVQVSSSGISFLQNLGQTHQLMGDTAHQLVDQSLYGVPVSSSRGSALDQIFPMGTERSSVPQMPTSTKSLHGNQLNFLPDRLTVQEGTSLSRQSFQNETNKHASRQSSMQMEFHQQVNSLQNNSTKQDHDGRQELPTLSETSHERFTMQVSSPQNEVTLDPAEEKILYGSDDNIWSAFGKLSNVSGESGNLFESSGIPNGFTSIQSGTWSALMQSAVAETSSTDILPQEGWSGLNLHNNEGSSVDQPPLIHNDNVKQASLPIDTRIPSATGTESIHSSNMYTLSPMGLNQLGHTFQREPSESVPADVSQRFGQSLAGTSKWLNHRQMQNSLPNEGDIRGNALESALSTERNGKTISADCSPAQSGTIPKPNGWNALVAVPPAGDRALNILDTEKVSHNSNEVKAYQGHMVDAGSLQKSSSLTIAAESNTVRSMTGNLQINKPIGDLNLQDAISSASSCSMVAGDGAYPFAQNNYLLNKWKHASSSTKFQGGESFGRMMDQVRNENQVSWKSSDKHESSKHDRENCAMKENSNENYRSNKSNNASGGFREIGSANVTDSGSLSSGKQKSSNLPTKKGSAPRKFQYHPMGNLDDDVGPTHGPKQPTQAQAIPLHNAHFSQLKLFGQIQRNPSEKDEVTKDCRHLSKEPSSGSLPGYAPGSSNLVSRSFDSSTNKASPPSQNMLELLHKVDQSRVNCSPTQLSSSERNVSSQPPEAEKSNGSAGCLQHSQSSLPQGFGLQLGPPSQLLQNPDLSSPSENDQGMVNATHTCQAGTRVGEKGMVLASSLRPRQSPNENSQMEYENDTSANPRYPGNDNKVSEASGKYYSAFTSDTPHVRSPFQNKQVTRLSASTATNQDIDSSFSYSTSDSMRRGSTETVLPVAFGNLQKNKSPSSGGTAQQSGPYDVQEIGPAGIASNRDQMHGSQHFGLPGISRQGSSSQVLSNTWTNVPTPQHTSMAQKSKGQKHFHELTQPNILESSSRGDLDVSEGSHLSSKSTAFHADSAVAIDRQDHNSGQLSSSKKEVSPGSASSNKNHLDESTANSASTKKNIEDFGRSLKPNAFSNEKFDLLNQIRALKNAEIDPSIRSSKRIKGPENINDFSQAHLMAEKLNKDDYRNSGSSIGLPPEDSRVVSFSTFDTLQRSILLHRNADTEDVATATSLHDSPSRPAADVTAVRAEHHMGSPQMAPSWFNQYGSFKNDQLLPLRSVRDVMSSRPEEPLFTPGTSSSIMDIPYVEDKTTGTPVDACQVSGSLQSSVPMVQANEQLSSLSLQMNVASQHEVILRPKKRKTATSELLSWYKEISLCSKSPSILSAIEADWSKAANRLTEKVEDDVDFIGDGPQVLRSKRRLILITQLMQQLFCSPPATILSADASFEYGTVAYDVSRVVLGDAYSALSTSRNLGLHWDGIDLHAIKGKLNHNPRFAKIIEDLFGKVTKLESYFSRLDKSASILDLRLECQDLEKFSVINRFAKFYGRGQNDNAETSSSDTTSAIRKPCAERYIIAVPMPRSLPDMLNGMSKLQEGGHEVSSNVP